MKLIFKLCDVTLNYLVYKLFRLKMPREMFDKIAQFLHYALVGLSNSVISYVVYRIFVAFGVHYTISNFLGFSISVLNAFYWSNKYVFKQETDEERVWWKTLIKTYASYAVCGLFLHTILLTFFVEYLCISKSLAPIILVFIITPLNYIFNKYWAYKEGSLAASPEDKKKQLMVLVLCLLFTIATIGLTVLIALPYKKANIAEETVDKSTAFVGDTNLGEYEIVLKSKKGTYEAAKELRRYIEEATGDKLKISIFDSEKAPNIELYCVKDFLGQSDSISDGTIKLIGKDKADLVKSVSAFANMYLGFSFAGEDRESFEYSEKLAIPENVYQIEEAWIAKREPIICLWKTNVPRGQYYNPNASLKSELLSLSDAALYDYVRLMKYCGFTGIQVTDMCAAWAQYGNYEFVHDRLRYMADAAHSLDMDVTLWVWGAEFEGYGWVDDSVVYYDYSKYAYSYECPEALATFNKYYDIYAELADVSDRVIMHFNDPSAIHKTEETAYYANLFREKVMAINPDLDFGVSDYTHKYDLTYWIDKLGTDITLYSDATKQEEYTENTFFRSVCAKYGTRYGVWSWNLCENEIDQLAEMNVNTKLIQNVYRLSQRDDEILKPEYWSEMDSYHFANIFSLYTAGHLLQNPDMDPEMLLFEVCEDLVGEKFSYSLLQVAKTIELARGAGTWEEYKWGYPEYKVASKDYPYEEVLQECGKALKNLEEMLLSDELVTVAPLSMPVKDLLKLMMPHIEQIRLYAEFRENLSKAEKMLSDGSEKTEIECFVASFYKAIPNFDTLIGVWGQSEAIAQYKLLYEFCQKAEIDMPRDDVFMHNVKTYLYSELCTLQKISGECYSTDFLSETIWGEALGNELVTQALDELIAEGLIKKDSSGKCYITDWEDYVFVR